MDTVVVFYRWLWILLMIAEAALIVRLILERLVSSYPIFTLYLSLDLVAGILLFQALARTLAYQRFFRVYVLMIAILRIGVVAELYERICKHFPGIGRLKLRLAGILLLVVAGLAFLCLPALGDRWGFPQQTLIYLLKQYQAELLAGLLLGIWLFFHFLRFAPHYRRNVIVHWRLVTLYFLVSAGHALWQLAARFGQAVHIANAAMLAADLALVIAWTVLLNRRGEELPAADFSDAEINGIEQKNAALVGFITQLPRQIATRQK